MTPFWHPLSTLLLTEPRCFATPHVLELLLRAEQGTELIYAGDRMWPAIPHGGRITVKPARPGELCRGDVVLVNPAGIPDLRRVATRDGDRLRLVADADPGSPLDVCCDEVLARARAPRRSCSRPAARLRRRLLDLREAWVGRSDPTADPSESVLDKYDSQAPFYAAVDGEELDRGLAGRIAEAVPRDATILVVGSGTGRECFALAAEGRPVAGVEFSPAMVAVSRKKAAERELGVEFHQADVRDHEVAAGTLGAVLFTYDVYSFLPRRADRVRLLRRTRAWLRPGGRVFLSARRLRTTWGLVLLCLQSLVLRRQTNAEWGDSHTRYIGADGRLQRSFVRVFTDLQLRSEIAAAGFRVEAWDGGHGTLVPSGD